MADLLELAERVEAGETTNPEISVALHVPPINAEAWVDKWNNYGILSATRVVLKHDDGSNGANWTAPNFLGSLDAAKALHDAMLPGWGCEMWARPDKGECGVMVYNKDHNPESNVSSFNLAAAWVAAILRAKAGMD